MKTAPIEYIEVDDRGVAKLIGHRIKVEHLVGLKQANGWTIEELHEQFPHVSMAKIHAAFSYYYDHQAEIDAQMERGLREYERLRAAAADSPMTQKLREVKKVRESGNLH